MSKKQRGSDKLMAECTTQGLTADELEQVAGGVNASSGYFRVFPRGLPWPEWLGNDAIQNIKQLGSARF